MLPPCLKMGGMVNSKLAGGELCAESFESLDRWLTQLRSNADPNIVVMVVGNKCDLAHLQKVSTEDAQGFCERQGLSFIETSALEATNVEQAFLQTLTEIYHIHSRQQPAGSEAKQAEVGRQDTCML